MSTPLRAGWYPDPAIPSIDRWWNGVSWSETRRNRPGSGVAPAAPGHPYLTMPASLPAPPQTRQGNVAAFTGFIVSVLSLLFFNVFTFGVAGIVGGIISLIGLRQSRVTGTGRVAAILGALLGFGGTILTWAFGIPILISVINAPDF